MYFSPRRAAASPWCRFDGTDRTEKKSIYDIFLILIVSH